MASVRCWLQLMAGPCREMEVRLVKAARKAGRFGQVLRGEAAKVQDRKGLLGEFIGWLDGDDQSDVEHIGKRRLWSASCVRTAYCLLH
jgi:hypothetical protein